MSLSSILPIVVAVFQVIVMILNLVLGGLGIGIL